MKHKLDKDIKDILLQEKDIKKICKDLGMQISRDYKNTKNRPLVIGILKGCIPFIADLCKNISIDIEISYIQASSYTNDKSTGNVLVSRHENLILENRDVIIVEDIIDTGLTLDAIKKVITEKNAKSVKIVTLLDKPTNRKINITADYVGHVVPNVFVVGYGFDFNESYRNLRYIGILKEEMYK